MSKKTANEPLIDCPAVVVSAHVLDESGGIIDYRTGPTGQFIARVIARVIARGIAQAVARALPAGQDAQPVRYHNGNRMPIVSPGQDDITGTTLLACRPAQNKINSGSSSYHEPGNYGANVLKTNVRAFTLKKRKKQY